jgi:hypothetical protein
MGLAMIRFLPFPALCLPGYPRSVVGRIVFGGKEDGVVATPEGIRWSFDFFPVISAGIDSALRQRTLILVSFRKLVKAFLLY